MRDRLTPAFFLFRQGRFGRVPSFRHLPILGACRRLLRGRVRRSLCIVSGRGANVHADQADVRSGGDGNTRPFAVSGVYYVVKAGGCAAISTAT